MELKQAVALGIRSDRSLGGKVEIQQVAADGLAPVRFSAKALIIQASSITLVASAECFDRLLHKPSGIRFASAFRSGRYGELSRHLAYE